VTGVCAAQGPFLLGGGSRIRTLESISHGFTDRCACNHALAGRLLLCQVGLRRRSRAALAGRAGLPGWGCFIPSTSRVGYHPWPGRKLGDDGGGLATGLQPGHGEVERCQEAPISLSRGSGWCLRLVSMVTDWSGRINPAARAFGVSRLTRPLQSLRRPGRRGRGQADQSLVELAAT
jgi:hypothetical protein